MTTSFFKDFENFFNRDGRMVLVGYGWTTEHRFTISSAETSITPKVTVVKHAVTYYDYNINYADWQSIEKLADFRIEENGRRPECNWLRKIEVYSGTFDTHKSHEEYFRSFRDSDLLEAIQKCFIKIYQ